MDNQGDTALHVATGDSKCTPQNRLMVIRHLLQREADTLLTNHKGIRAIDILPKNEEICKHEIHDRMIHQKGKYI